MGSDDSLTLTILGCSGTYPGPGQACSGYLVRFGGTIVWLDAGTGTLANLQNHVGLGDVDAIVISHAHPDHWSDIEGFYVACRYVVPRAGIPVYAPAAVQGLLRGGGSTEPVLRWHDISDGDVVELGPMRWSFAQTDHPPETLGMRIDAGGRSLGYSADSSPAWSLEALGPGLHLALCEATFLRDQEGSAPHMSARQAGVTARAAGAERLLLTHLWPITDPSAACDEAATTFGGPVEAAVQNQTYAV